MGDVNSIPVHLPVRCSYLPDASALGIWYYSHIRVSGCELLQLYSLCRKVAVIHEVHIRVAGAFTPGLQTGGKVFQCTMNRDDDRGRGIGELWKVCFLGEA